MGETLIVILLLFIPVVLVTSYVYVSRRHYEHARLHRKVHYHMKRK